MARQMERAYSGYDRQSRRQYLAVHQVEVASIWLSIVIVAILSRSPFRSVS